MTLKVHDPGWFLYFLQKWMVSIYNKYNNGFRRSHPDSDRITQNCRLYGDAHRRRDHVYTESGSHLPKESFRIFLPESSFGFMFFIILGMQFAFPIGNRGNAMLFAQTANDSSLAGPAKADSVRLVFKSPRGAMLRSLTVPGWGQLYNGKWFKAILAAGGEIGLVTNAVIQNQYAVKATTKLEKEFYQDNRRLSLWWLGAVLLYSIADAYVDAQLYHFDESPSLSFYSDKKSMGAAFTFYF